MRGARPRSSSAATRWPTPTTLGRFLRRFTLGHIGQLNRALDRLFARVHPLLARGTTIPQNDYGRFTSRALDAAVSRLRREGVPLINIWGVGWLLPEHALRPTSSDQVGQPQEPFKHPLVEARAL